MRISALSLGLLGLDRLFFGTATSLKNTCCDLHGHKRFARIAH